MASVKKRLAMCLILFVFLAVKNYECFQSSNYIRIDGLKYNGSSNEIIYKSKIVLAAYSTLVIAISGVNYSNYGYTVFQAHCLHHNISVVLESNFGDAVHQSGTNIGFLLTTSDARKIFRLINDNFLDVNCLVALIAYTKSSPIPGRCSMDIKSSNLQMLKIRESDSYATVVIPNATEYDKSCEDSHMTYETYYTYLEIMNFEADAYFEGIEKMMFNNTLTAYRTKHVTSHNEHLLETIPGRGLIINTAIISDSGQVSFYVPVATYSCPSNTWSARCTDSNYIKRGISILLVIHSIVMILNLMSPDFIESILNGMLFGALLTVVFVKTHNIEFQPFDYFILIIIGACFMSAIIGLVTLYIPTGRYLSKVTFSAFVVIFIMEIFFETIISVYLQFIMAIVLSIMISFIPITFAVITGSIILILNMSYLLKVGNLHRIVVNNFIAITTFPVGFEDESYFDFIRPNYINYRVSLNIVDYGLILFFILCSIYLTFRKEKYFFGHPNVVQRDNIFSDSASIRDYNCEVARRRRDQCIVGIRRTSKRGGYRVISRCRKHLHFKSNLINERSPLISHWMTNDDEEDIFRTPPDTSSKIKINTSSSSDQQQTPVEEVHEDDTDDQVEQIPTDSD